MSDFDQAAEGAVPGGGPPSLEPKRTKVFGTIHIAFGGLGLLMSVASLVMMQFQAAPGAEDYNRVTLELAEKVKRMSYVGLVCTVILGSLLLTPVIGAIYPILVLALLNKPIVKRFFAAQGQ